MCNEAVWKELEKENKEFFETYYSSSGRKTGADRTCETKASQRIQNMVSQSDASSQQQQL